MSAASDAETSDSGSGIDEERVLEAGSTENEKPAGPQALEDKLAALQLSADENRDRYLRTAAELENVRKRAAREVDKARKFALERFCEELLAVKDSLELGIAAGDEAEADALRQGSMATLKLLANVFEQFGVAEVDPHGEPFDPELHEAMSMQPATDVEPGSVVNVFQKGYTLNGRLLRPARVVVAADLPNPTGEGENQ